MRSLARTHKLGPFGEIWQWAVTFSETDNIWRGTVAYQNDVGEWVFVNTSLEFTDEDAFHQHVDMFVDGFNTATG